MSNPNQNDFSELVAENQRRRYSVLKFIYEIATPTRKVIVPKDALAISMNLDVWEDNLDAALEYLESEGLISFIDDEGTCVQITHQGVKEVEQSLSSPAEATKHFPAYIVQNFNAPFYGANQIGGERNSQTVSVSNTQNAAVQNSVEKLIKLISESSLQETDKEEILVEAQRIKELAKKEQTPDVSEKMKKRLEALKTGIEVAKDGGELALKATPHLTTLWEWIKAVLG